MTGVQTCALPIWIRSRRSAKREPANAPSPSRTRSTSRASRPVNVKVRERIDPRTSEPIQAHVRRVEEALGSTGRVVLRASGTEPLIRVMVEGQDEAIVNRYANELAETVRRAV